MTLDEVAAIADPAGPADHDVARYGKLAAKMLSEGKRDVALAPANEKKIVFRDVAKKFGQAVVDQWIDNPAMIDTLQGIATAHGSFGMSREELQQLIADAVQSVSIKAKGLLDQSVSNTPTRRLITHRASDLQPEKLVWIWQGRIAEGKLCLLGGPPGLGKSQLTTCIAATISNGGCWPCDEGTTDVGSVIIMSAEDGIEDTIVPRLIAAGADLHRVHIVRAATKADGTGRKTFSLKTDVDLLEKKAKEIGDVRLIVVDPISAYMDGADGNGNVETRAVLEPLAEMANRLRIAVVAVTHLNKGGGGNQTPMNRFCGSIAFIAAARTAFLVVADPENPDRRLLLQVKNNLAKDCSGLAFRMEQRLVAEDIVSSHVIFFDEEVSMTVEQALAAYEARGSNGGQSASAKRVAIEFLTELLANGPIDIEVAEDHARQAGLLNEGKRIGDSKPFRDARVALGIVSKRVGFGKGARYEISLPADTCAPKSTMGAHS